MHEELVRTAMHQGGGGRVEDNEGVRNQLLFLARTDPGVRHHPYAATCSPLRTHCFALLAHSPYSRVVLAAEQKWREIKVLELALAARAEAAAARRLAAEEEQERRQQRQRGGRRRAPSEESEASDEYF